MSSLTAGAAVRPHDLLRVAGDAGLLTEESLPSWAERSLSDQPWVVVRRESPPAGLAAVGIRGQQRHERAAAFIPVTAIAGIVRPEDLVNVLPDATDPGLAPRTPALAALHVVSGFLSDLGLAWGPVGAVGFELATGAKVTHARSDLDLVIRCPTAPAVEWANRVATWLTSLSAVKIDCLLEIPEGGLALAEIASNPDSVVLRTHNGPRLVTVRALAANGEVRR